MTRFLPTTLTGRLTAALVALVAFVGIGVSALTAVTMRSYLTDRLDTQLHESLDRQTREFDQQNDSPRPPVSDPLPIALGQQSGTLTAVLSDFAAQGDLVGDGERNALSDSVLADLADLPADDSVRTVDLDGLGTYRLLVVDTGNGTRVVGGLPTTEVDDTISSLLLWEAALTLTGVVLATAIGRFVVRRQLRPLRDVASTAHEVASLPLSSGKVAETPRVPDSLTDPSTEVGRVGDALNTMLDHVEASLAARHESELHVRRFVADASHELRTPLATITGYAELIHRSGEDPPEVVARALAKIETEAARMSALVSDLLLLARLDAGRPLDNAPVDLSRIVLEAVDDRRVVARDHTWEVDVPEDAVEIYGDAERLHQAITNLLVNASRHTPAGTHVTTTIEPVGGDQIQVTVHDNGPGIDAALLPGIFDRFARGDSSRTRASGGTGLGTSLVSAIARAHGGSATATSKPGSTTFTMTLPIRAPEQSS